MSILVGSTSVADIRVQGVTLRSLVGAYELLFGLHATINGFQDVRRLVVLAGAEVTVRSAGGTRGMGFARPNLPIRLQTANSSSIATPFLKLTLSPQQLSALNELRQEGDLTFELQAIGEGGDSKIFHEVQDTWHTQIPRSTWLEQLRNCGAMEYLLFEAPISPHQSSEHLLEAYKHFLNGDYRACIASCRSVLQETVQRKLGKQDWANQSLTKLSGGASPVKEDREVAFIAAIRSYTNQAHHPESEGGISIYTRSEAQLILTCSAAIVARWLKQI